MQEPVAEIVGDKRHIDALVGQDEHGIGMHGGQLTSIAVADIRQIDREVVLSLDPLQPSWDWPDRSASPGSNLVRSEREAALNAAVERLPEHYRIVLTWHHGERLPFAEIGLRLGSTAEAARKLWGRALKLLNKELGRTHDLR